MMLDIQNQFCLTLPHSASLKSSWCLPEIGDKKETKPITDLAKYLILKCGPVAQLDRAAPS